MSEQENVELVQRAVDAVNRRDLDAYLALQDSGMEFTPYERAVEGLGPYRMTACVHGGKIRSRRSRTSPQSSTMSEPGATKPLRAAAFTGRAQGAAQPLIGRCGWPMNGVRRRRSGGTPSKVRPKPSKPLGSGGRRSRRRTRPRALDQRRPGTRQLRLGRVGPPPRSSL
jgi:hypothetical protein